MHLLNLSGKIKGAKILCIYFYLAYLAYLVCQSAFKISKLTDRIREQKPRTGKDIPTEETLLRFCCCGRWVSLGYYPFSFEDQSLLWLAFKNYRKFKQLPQHFHSSSRKFFRLSSRGALKLSVVVVFGQCIVLRAFTMAIRPVIYPLRPVTVRTFVYLDSILMKAKPEELLILHILAWVSPVRALGFLISTQNPLTLTNSPSLDLLIFTGDARICILNFYWSKKEYK